MRLLFALVVFVVVVGTTTPARADGRKEAAREFAAGEAADRRGDYEAAIAAYKRAFDRVPHHFAAYNIAVDHERLGQFREAAAWFTRYLDMAPAAQDRDSVEQQLVALKLRPAGLTVTSRPAGARVLIDNRYVGVTPYFKVIRGGGHRVAVVHRGQRDERDIVLEFGEPATIDVVLGEREAAPRPARAPPTGPSGVLEVRGSPRGAVVAIDGEVVGNLPASIPVATGTHTIKITSFGYAPDVKTVTVEPDQVTAVDVRLDTATGAAARSGTPTRTLQGSYLIGVSGGVDARGDGGGMVLVEVGVRAARTDFVARFGRQPDLTVFDLLGRYAFSSARLSPFVALGYVSAVPRDEGSSSSSPGSGVLLLGGLRFDLTRGDKAGVSLLAESGVRAYGGASIARPGEARESRSGVFIPLMLSVQLMYGRGR